MARIQIPALTLWITSACVEHPRDLVSAVAARCGVGRVTAGKALQRLTELNWLVRDGTARRPTYRPGLLRQVVQRYTLQGLREDLAWSRDFAPYFELAAPLRRVVQHVFSELVNNAGDHSEGQNVTVSLRQTPSHVQLLVSDDGRGVFDQIKQQFALDTPQLAMLELSKGKLTSQPERHTGRGLFFTSRLADVFDLHANESAFQRRNWEGGGWHTGRPLKRQGTSVYASFAVDTPRTLESVLNAHSLDGAGWCFETTSVPLRLLTSNRVDLDARSQARHVAARLQNFRRAEIDFSGVDHIGHGFADELFRVIAKQQPALQLDPVNLSPAVAAMLRSLGD